MELFSLFFINIANILLPWESLPFYFPQLEKFFHFFIFSSQSSFLESNLLWSISFLSLFSSSGLILPTENSSSLLLLFLILGFPEHWLWTTPTSKLFLTNIQRKIKCQVLKDYTWGLHMPGRYSSFLSKLPALILLIINASHFLCLPQWRAGPTRAEYLSRLFTVILPALVST